MRSTTLLSFLATGISLVHASPMNDLTPRSLETTLFKRDEVLDKRGLELAALHGVDTSQMYRHSHVRRSDGDDITIWVNNSYNESQSTGPDTGDDTEQLETRQSKKGYKIHGKFMDNESLWVRRADSCGKSTFESLTNADAAFTGGVIELQRWGHSRRGAFWIEAPGSGHQTLIVAGSNSGSNAAFRARRIRTPEVAVGSWDIGDLARDSLGFQRTYNGRQRVAARGEMNCVSPMAPGTTDWRIVKTTGVVPI